MPASASDKLLLERLENVFTYHAPDPVRVERYEQLRGAVKEIARLMVELCPDSMERSSALQKLEEAVMWANAAIARNQLE
jgi:hypothetical protein